MLISCRGQYFQNYIAYVVNLLKVYVWNSKKVLQKSAIQLFLFLLFFGFLYCRISYSMDCGADVNPALKTVCDIIMFLQGRIGRALIAFSVMLAAWGFINGSFKWQDMLSLSVGVGAYLAPLTTAVWLSPEKIMLSTGEVITAAEIISCACPNLR